MPDRGKLREMGEKGREWVLENLAPDHVARQFEKLYQDAMAA